MDLLCLVPFGPGRVKFEEWLVSSNPSMAAVVNHVRSIEMCDGYARSIPTLPMDHEDCKGAGMPCPRCNSGPGIPAFPSNFVPDPDLTNPETHPDFRSKEEQQFDISEHRRVHSSKLRHDDEEQLGPPSERFSKRAPAKRKRDKGRQR